MVNVEQTRDENKEKYQLGDYPLITTTTTTTAFI